MATMIKEKRRERKKSKKKDVVNANEEPASCAATSKLSSEELNVSFEENLFDDNVVKSVTPQEVIENVITPIDKDLDDTTITSEGTHHEIEITQSKNEISECPVQTKTAKPLRDEHPGQTYGDLNSKLEIITIPCLKSEIITSEQEHVLEIPVDIETETKVLDSSNLEMPLKEEESLSENVAPSAPPLDSEEVMQPASICNEQIINVTHERDEKPEESCMPLEQAIWLYGGEQIAEVRMLSEIEEAAVENGPASGPEHPLVDLLSTLRQSFICLEKDRTQLFQSFAEEEKGRISLWKIEKKTANAYEKCPCGETVYWKAKYDHAEFLEDKLPATRIRLAVILKDVQECYCHHQHSALLAFYQIEEFICQIIKSNKNEIREALSLVMQALKVSDTAPPVLAQLLERWAQELACALVDGRDLRQLLFLIHQLFRQARSVRWACRAIRTSAADRVSAARTLALLDLILARPALETAHECTEGSEEVWEEVSGRGASGAVGDGVWRERDLLAVVRALPLRELVQTLVLFTHSDVRRAREQEWGDPGCGRGVLFACAGTRALLSTLQRARRLHAHYARLYRVLLHAAACTLHALAALHAHSKSTYDHKLRDKITAELVACFAAGVQLCEPRDLHRIPTTLLNDRKAKEYCIDMIFSLHEKCAQQLDSLSVSVPALSCATRLRVATQAALDRADDHQLANMILEFLMMTGLKKKSVSCKEGCESTARELLPRLLAAHPYLYNAALHLLTEMSQAETLEPECVRHLRVEQWRPSTGEVQHVLEEWGSRCSALLPQLLLQLDYTPHSGLSLESQLTIGRWLCSGAKRQGGGEEVWWEVVRRLRPHRAWWGPSLCAPDPDAPPPHADLLATALTLLSTSWGHSIPIICMEGASALCRLAAARPADAVHCLGPILIVMAESPDSVSHAPKFAEVFDVVGSAGPGLVQRALRVGGDGGALLLRRLLLHQLLDPPAFAMQPDRGALLSVWLHATWRPQQSTALLALADCALAAARLWQRADAHAARLVQECSKEQIWQWCRQASTAPLLVECALRALHAGPQRALQAPLLAALHQQRINQQRINVDAALQGLGCGVRAEELVVHLAAAAAQAAPPRHPAHLALWRLLMQLYLQRPPNTPETTPPVGPLFFSGIIKSRTMASIKKRLQENIAYHQKEAETLKPSQGDTETKPTTSTDDNPESTRNNMKLQDHDKFLTGLSITDFTESSESSDDETSSSDDTNDEDDEPKIDVLTDEVERETIMMVSYHVAAEKMFREYLRWLDEGDNVRAQPHHADISNFIPDQALECAWRKYCEGQRGAGAPLPPACAPRPPPRAPRSPLATAIRYILAIKERPRHRTHATKLKSVISDTISTDARTLLSQIDKHLQDMEKYARQWTAEVRHISLLNEKLIEDVLRLHVSRAIPPRRVSCRNKCAPLLLTLPSKEWIISTGAEKGIAENRRSARAALRRLAAAAGARVAARAHAAILALANRVRSAALAERACERAWRGAAACGGCGPAHHALTALLDLLAHRWICGEGAACAALVSRWAGSGGAGLRDALRGALVQPRLTPAHHWPALYAALLRLRLPSDVTFSYLSRFELSRWSEVASPEARREMLETLAAAVTQWGPDPEPEHHVLLELLGVQRAALVRAEDVCGVACAAARDCAAARLPAAHCPHLLRALDAHAHLLPLDQLGNLLRSLGAIWWEARASVTEPLSERYAQYAPHMSAMLQALQRQFVAAAVAMNYTPERVCVYAWSGCREAWAPWVQPAPRHLLRAAPSHHMLASFANTLLQIIEDCPGIESPLLAEVWEWAGAVCVQHAGATAEERAAARALLAALGRLPFHSHQWLRDNHLHLALQICRCPESELREWLASTVRSQSAQAWLGNSPDDLLAPRLAALLALFTAPDVMYHEQTLEEATQLPWWRLPDIAVDEALDRFYIEHYNLLQPYHEAPHFRVLLSACELRGGGACAVRVSCGARTKRARGVSAWVRAASAPPLRDHLPTHAAALLRLLSDIAPQIEESEGELEDLLSRAIVIMCIDPANNVAVPVWEKWLCSCACRESRACVSAVCSLTAFEPFAALADAAARALLAHTDGGGWAEVSRRWSSIPWADSGALVARSRLHAAYGVALATHQPALHTALLALLAADIHFVENEAIVCVWICFACRAGVRGSAGAEVRSAVRALVARWAEPPHALLRLVPLRRAALPTPLHRVLCNLALCILSPGSEGAVRGFESACGAAGVPGEAALARAPLTARQLPALAARLLPAKQHYFHYELEATTDTTDVPETV